MGPRSLLVYGVVMADRWIEYKIENEKEILAGFDKEQAKARRHLHDLLDDISKAGVRLLRYHVPTYSRYLIRHVDRSPETWSPGGIGGGGSWDRIVGIKAGSSRHPLYVEFGTGIYGLVGWYILPLKAQFMVFYGSKAKRILRKRAIRGQQPQRYFYTTWLELNVYAHARIIGNIH